MIAYYNKRQIFYFSIQLNYLKLSMQKYSQIHLSDQYVVHLNNVLGKGSTGSVYQGFDLKKNEKVAVKVIDLSCIDNEVTKYLLKMQKNAIMMLQNPAILKGLKVFQDEKYCFMVTQFCNGGTLKKYINDRNTISQQKSMQIIKSILQGYQNLVDNKVVHRDLKPANIMMHNDLPKIIDFGYCQIQGYQKPSLQYNVGSPSYMAPESFDLNVYNQKTQIWSIGIILFQCLTGRTVDQGRNMNQVYNLMEMHGILYPDFVSQKCRTIIDWCTQMSPKKRPTCAELYDKYFRQFRLSDKVISEQGMKTYKSISTQSKTIENSSNKQINFPSFTVLNQKAPLSKQRSVFGTLQSPYQNTINNKYANNRTKTAFSYYQSVKNSQIFKQPQANQYYEKSQKPKPEAYTNRYIPPQNNLIVPEYMTDKNIRKKSLAGEQILKSKQYDNFFKANPQMNIIQNNKPYDYRQQNIPNTYRSISISGYYGHENYMNIPNIMHQNPKMTASIKINIDNNKFNGMKSNYNPLTQRQRRTTFRI